MAGKVIGKTELISLVAKKTRWTKAEVTLIIDEFLKQIGKNLKKYRDDDVSIRIMNFGSFKVSFVEGRKGVSPLDSSKKMVFPSRYQVRFSSGQKLKDIINNGKDDAKKAVKEAKKSSKKKSKKSDDDEE